MLSCPLFSLGPELVFDITKQETKKETRLQVPSYVLDIKVTYLGQKEHALPYLFVRHGLLFAILNAIGCFKQRGPTCIQKLFLSSSSKAVLLAIFSITTSRSHSRNKFYNFFSRNPTHASSYTLLYRRKRRCFSYRNKVLAKAFFFLHGNKTNVDNNRERVFESVSYVPRWKDRVLYPS